MQKITPHLWFNTEAQQAAELYAAVFPNSHVTSTTVLHDTPGGDSAVVSFEIDGYKFMAISAGPLFTINPAISFMVNFDPSRDKEAETKLKAIWEQLAEGGKVLMPLQTYDFSKLYGWIQDKFGVSWQLILGDEGGDPRPFIVPSLLFTQDKAGKAEQAAVYYQSVFKESSAGITARYPEGSGVDEGTIMYSDFQLANQWFASMDSAQTHEFTFNEGVSFIVSCENQEEIDYFWSKLSTVPEAEQCGWCKDQFGVSWQIVPTRMQEMMSKGTPEQIARVAQAFMPMKKFDVEALEKAFADTK